MASSEPDVSRAHAIEPKTERERHIVHQLGDKYQFIKRLGQGSTSAVYAVNNRSLNRVEALKVYLSDLMWDSEFLDRFQIEAKICASFVHPNIVTIYDYKKLNEFYFFSMLFVDGPSLNSFLDASNRMPDSQICTKIATICDAIGYAHERGVIHRDVKASNIMLDQSGTPYITDFGIAKCELYETQTQSGALMGTPHYVSPEQVEGVELDGRADVYSLGITLYALLTHKYPFQGQTAMSIISRRLSHDPVPPETYRADLHPRLCEIIAKTLQLERRDRYQTMAELADDLNDFVRNTNPEKRQGSVDADQSQATTPQPKRRLAWLSLIGSVSILCIAALIFWPVSEPNVPPPEKTIKVPQIEATQRPDSGNTQASMEDKSTRTRPLQLAALETIKEKISAGELAEASDLIGTLSDETDLPPAIRTALQDQADIIKAKQEASARELQAEEVEKELTGWIGEMRQSFEKKDYEAVSRLASAMKAKVQDLPQEDKTRYAALIEQMEGYQSKVDAAIQKRQRQRAQLEAVKAKIAKGERKEASALIDKMLADPDILPEMGRELDTHRDTIKQKEREQLRRAQKKRQIDAQLKGLVANIERHYHGGDYSACLVAVSKASAIIDKMPAHEKKGYSNIRSKIDGYHLKADTAIETRKRQLTEFTTIKKKVADGDLEEAITLIDAMLAQANLSADIQKMLHSQRKIIEQIVEQ